MGVVDGIVHDRVLVVRMAGAGANALDREMAGQLHALAGRAAQSPEIGAVLITGAFGNAFCGGSNIKELTALHDSGAGPSSLLRAEAAAFAAIAALDKPVVAAIEGPAVGGGLELALCCDVIIAADTARLSLPEINIGVFPALGGTVRLQRRIGEGRARAMLFQGEEISARQALDWGLVNEVVPTVQVYRHARALAARMAAGPAMAMAGIKQSLRLAAQGDDDAALAAALAAAEAHGQSSEVAEGFRAFAAKESPDFTRTRMVAANVTPLSAHHAGLQKARKP